MKRTALVGASILAAGIASLAIALPQDEGVKASGVRVGVFDSRALAVAFAASDEHDEYLKELLAERDRLEREGDDEGVKRVEAQGRARQARMHKQGFSTAPVDDILAEMEDALPQIAERAGVDLIVSRWRVAYLDPGARLVDVTDLMVEPFDPSEQTLIGIRELRKKDPLSLYGTDWEAIERH